MGTRRLGRELAVQALYRMAVTGEPDIAPVFWEQFGGEADEARRFAMHLVEGVTGARPTLDRLVAEAAEHWRLERIAMVERCILAVAAYELQADTHTPVSVVIDEAVEIARRFGADESAAFVNGVLDRVARIVRGPETEVTSRARD